MTKEAHQERLNRLNRGLSYFGINNDPEQRLAVQALIATVTLYLVRGEVMLNRDIEPLEMITGVSRDQAGGVAR